MARCFTVLSIILCLGTATAFAPGTAFASKPTTICSLRMSNDMTEPTDSSSSSSIESLPLVAKLVGVLAIKTAKDVVNYPPMLLDKALLEQQDDYDLPKTNPFVMLAKLIGIFVFKTVHDALYFPTLWTERLVQCQSLEECELD